MDPLGSKTKVVWSLFVIQIKPPSGGMLGEVTANLAGLASGESSSFPIFLTDPIQAPNPKTQSLNPILPGQPPVSGRVGESSGSRPFAFKPSFADSPALLPASCLLGFKA